MLSMMQLQKAYDKMFPSRLAVSAGLLVLLAASGEYALQRMGCMLVGAAPLPQLHIWLFAS
jgi:hypothetical protein